MVISFSLFSPASPLVTWVRRNPQRAQLFLADGGCYVQPSHQPCLVGAGEYRYNYGEQQGSSQNAGIQGRLNDQAERLKLEGSDQ